jgi:hypothetical protein
MLRDCRVIIHPILFSIYPALFIFASNVTQIDPIDLVSPVIALLLLGLTIWLLARVLLGDDDKAALVTSFSMFMLSSFQHFYRVFKIASGWQTLDRPNAVILWLFLFIGGIFVICYTRKWIITVTRFTNVLAVFLLLLSVITAVRQAYAQSDLQSSEAANLADLDWVKNWIQASQKLPDIYYIILDGYGRGDALKKSYGFDNQVFLNTLKSKGFVVLDQSTSNYPDTVQSITSSLNMDYVQDRGYSLRYSKVALLMRALGYKYIFVPSGFSFTNSSPLADVSIKLDISPQSELSAMLLEYSVLGYFLPSSASLTKIAIWKGVFENARGTAQWHKQISRSIEAIERIPQIEQPTFTFAHIISPHPPYVFNRDGSLYENSTMSQIGNFDNYNWWSESALFVNQITHLNRLLETMVTELLTKSPTPPIIILQGDHGTFAFSGKQWNTANPSADAIKERMSILLALYVPDVIRIRLYDYITPVNIFRIVFNQYFGANYPLLPENNFWAFSKPVQDVTQIVRSRQEHKSR